MKSFLIALCVLWLLLLSIVQAQNPTAVRHIGILSGGVFPGSPGAPRSRWSPHYAFLEGLKELGWVHGENIIIESRYAGGKLDRLPALARELVGMKVEVIVVFGSPPVKPAMEATRTIPIVMISGSADPVADGLVASFAHPGGNVTGVTWSTGPELLGKHLAILKEIIPGMSRVALLLDGAIRPSSLHAWMEASERLNIKVHRFEIYDRSGIEPAIGGISRARAEAMYVGMGAGTYSWRNQIAALALAHRIPAVATGRELPEAGGLLSYGPNNAEQFRRGATYVDRILKGAKPEDLPIDQPTKFELVINMKTAKALGVAIPQSLLLQADDVIE